MGKKKRSSSVPVGSTLWTSDWYLPYDKKNTANMKTKRRVAVIDKNNSDELAVVRLTTQKQPNTTYLQGYRAKNGRKTYFKHFVEITDEKGKPIRVDGSRFALNNDDRSLTPDEVVFVRKRVYYHSRQASDNRRKLSVLKNKRKR